MNSAISKRIKELKSTMNKTSFIFFSKLSTFFNTLSSAFDKNTAAREYKIMIDNADYSGQYSLIHVANGPYFDGKMTGVLDAKPDDGLLNVALIRSSHPMKTLSSISRYSRGKRPNNCVVVQGKKVSIQATQQMWIQLDNEYIQDTSINISVVENAVQMVTVNNLTYQSPPSAVK